MVFLIFKGKLALNGEILGEVEDDQKRRISKGTFSIIFVTYSNTVVFIWKVYVVTIPPLLYIYI